MTDPICIPWPTLLAGRAEQAARVADEADGDPERTALRATIAALQASIATAEKARAVAALDGLIAGGGK